MTESQSMPLEDTYSTGRRDAAVEIRDKLKTPSEDAIKAGCDALSNSAGRPTQEVVGQIYLAIIERMLNV